MYIEEERRSSVSPNAELGMSVIPSSDRDDSKHVSHNYPWILWPKDAYTLWLTVFSLIIVGGAALFYFWYNVHTADSAPDSIVGLCYGYVGLAAVLLALLLYSIRRRRGGRHMGGLNRALQRHIALGCIGLALLLLHSFGNLNLRSGTYALYALLSLVISGLVGRVLDYLLPRMIAIEAQKALTAEGESRLEMVTQTLYHMAAVGEPFAVSPDHSEVVSIDPDRHLQAMVPYAQSSLKEIWAIRQSMQRERFYRGMLRAWRHVHIALAIITTLTTVWHILYAVTLWFH